MNSHVLHTLEFNQIQKMLVDRAGSTLSKEMAMKWCPSSEYEIIQNWLNETDEAFRCLHKEVSMPLGQTHDIRTVLSKAEKDICIMPNEFTDLLTTLLTYEKMHHYFEGERHLIYPTLESLSQRMISMEGLVLKLNRVFDDTGKIKDNASSKLSRIRTTIVALKSRIRRALQHIINDKEQAVFFRDAIITQRNDRYVVPIKEEYRYRFDGIVHDRSSTGQTLYMEPMISVQLNNDLTEAYAEEKSEIRNILLSLTKEVYKNSKEIYLNCELATQMEFVFARGQLALDMQGIRAVCSKNGEVYLKEARHPLIDVKKVVPISLPLGKDYKVLVVTGSNAGGKTIAIKTLGILALMNQAGLFIPAQEGSLLPIYENIYAIIGDDQSIQYNLSTFSSYITQLSSFLDKCTSSDLVLLDELGSGTDPIEGAALAESVTEFLCQKQVSTIITSHFSEMKKMAYESEGIENAFVEFDLKTLMPTYRLIIGVAGNSNAFNICRRLHLTDEVINKAIKLKQNSPYNNMESIMSNLNEQMQQIQKDKLLIEKTLYESQLLRDELKKERDLLFAKRKQILEKTREESEAIKRNLRVESELIIKELKKKVSSMNRETLNLHVAHIRDKIDGLRLPNNKLEIQKEYPKTLAVGDMVFIDTLGSNGTITAISGKKITIACGTINVTVDKKHCFIPEKSNISSSVKVTPKIRVSKNYRETAISKVSTTLNIIGKTVDESIFEVDKFLNDAFMAGISPVQIIHGKGTGSLRKGIHIHLRTLPFIKEFHLADARNGGAGVTEVYL